MESSEEEWARWSAFLRRVRETENIRGVWWLNCWVMLWRLSKCWCEITQESASCSVLEVERKSCTVCIGSRWRTEWVTRIMHEEEELNEPMKVCLVAACCLSSFLCFYFRQQGFNSCCLVWVQAASLSFACFHHSYITIYMKQSFFNRVWCVDLVADKCCKCKCGKWILFQESQSGCPHAWFTASLTSNIRYWMIKLWKCVHMKRVIKLFMAVS